MSDYSIEDFMGNPKDFQNVDLKLFMKGELDLTTMKKRKKTKFDYEKALSFIKCEPKATHSTLFNLCSITYGFDNFQTLQL